MANQMIALQARNPQLPDPSRAATQYANMMNMASQQRASQLQGERIRQEMEFAKAAEGRAVAGESRAEQKFSVEQSKALVSALGTGIVKILRDPSDASIGQVGQTFAAVGLEQSQFGPLLKQIQDIPDANDRKLFVMDLVTQSPEATQTLKAVMPEVKSEKVGDATVFYDANANSANFGQEIFRFTVAPEPVKMTQNVVDGVLMNTNPVTGVAAEALVGDPTQGSSLPAREPTYSSTGVRSPYAVGAGTGQRPMMPAVAPTAPPAQAVGVPVGGAARAPGSGKDTFKIMIGMESRGKQFDRSGATLTSPKGALGIAQIMPATAPEAAKLAGLPYDKARLRNDEAYNLALGEAYFNKQLRDFGDPRLAAAAYNAGPGAVRRALQKGGPDGWINHVPRETQKYVAQIPGGDGGKTPARTPTGGAGTATATGAPLTVSAQQQQKAFKKTLEMVNYDAKTGAEMVSDLIKSSTSGGAEKLGSDVVGFFGTATPGRVALGQLATLKDSMTFEKLRGKLGAQISDADVRLVANTMGDIANPDIPANERLAKWQNIVLPILVRGAGLTPVKPRATPTGGSKGKPPLDSFRRK